MNDHEIEEGREGWGSHLAPPEPPCECVVQPTVQSESVCTGDCTAHCTGDCTTDRITLVGVRGGSGTSTIGAALALISRAMVRAELVTADPVLSAALLGVGPPDQLPAEVLGRLVVAQEASGEAELTIIETGTATEPSVRPRGGRRAPPGHPAEPLLPRTPDPARRPARPRRARPGGRAGPGPHRARRHRRHWPRRRRHGARHARRRSYDRRRPPRHTSREPARVRRPPSLADTAAARPLPEPPATQESHCTNPARNDRHRLASCALRNWLELPRAVGEGTP